MIEFFLWHGIVVISVMTASFIAGYVTRGLLYNKHKR